MRLHAPFVFVILLAASGAHAEKIYSWKDADGNFHFGYAPPPDGQAASSSGAPDKPSAYQSGADEHARMMERYQKAQSGMSDMRPAQPPSTPRLHAGSPDDFKEVPLTDMASGGSQRCKDMAQRISDLPRGTSGSALSQQLGRLCPKVSYECRRYHRHPQDNRCVTVPRNNDSVIRVLETD